jgi:hypothetical protein
MDRNLKLTSLVVPAIALLAACEGSVQTCAPQTVSLEGACRFAAGDLSVADLQAVGSHNSYKIAIPPPELKLIALTSTEAANSLDYGHIPLAEQLDLGMRQLEIDVFHDPEGGRYADPALPKLTAGQPGAEPYDPTAMETPGFKVLHIQDVDPRSQCPTLIACLDEIDAWSQANPAHVPLLIMINIKSGSLEIPGTVDALAFDAGAFDALDGEIRSVFAPERLVTPDDVRGDAASLREAVLAEGWPSLNASRGKLLFVLETGAEHVRTYLRGNTSLEGFPMFVRSLSPDDDHAAFFTINDPLRDGETIRRRVLEGFLVRTRADAATLEARAGDTRRREAAFTSGAQYISTDFYQPRSEWSDYSVSLPGGSAARCNPVRRDAACARRPGFEPAQ